LLPSTRIAVKLLVQLLLPAILDLIEDKTSCILLAFIAWIPLLAHQLGPEFFVERLLVPHVL
jgi:serine/threonine-protein phosphatase 2A regulatory subunit A